MEGPEHIGREVTNCVHPNHNCQSTNMWEEKGLGKIRKVRSEGKKDQEKVKGTLVVVVVVSSNLNLNTTAILSPTILKITKCNL